ncbi:deoxyribose-phosphate aldolase [Candidatus Giovannonibacteria bacterium RIFCSPHIGHO2_02_43_13]|uniref:Deoxyribose-phosphate aldolase n=1 Tax=Candidatus Giovannonibacteria bacterium RIFCSPHIGHO2_02_43_13 TaxID=1798330 RepID=A0A1F5WUZ3_9BACT|nr:MAG: deoxyribose-phosphate aldolase [Candidatus Giovannonibacteria bacterium RIFCSPHIGHO2_12_FULL_44_42]OGF79423.1 MAG: deoxyribose-phosphate aldolase [Candidatus Giovannonibacteria bacterium RIFCSPHIGHO2_02_43_13]OGF89023.1 MAG: deoxyribose-phosphate aldolase [Candidatus Giovannonibacteria bacterium RIFCSPLOWO2_02_FULL_43_54]OGF97192.1 MAG: deoxyribose-phosphate aldolase [Candidatus Giovannonibacteria bacterium RIFCSPLOWO2_12_FULL_44_32]
MNIAKYIDHTLLKPDATRGQIVKLCHEAKDYGFASVCVNPVWIPKCVVELKDLGQKTDVKVCSVVGFPLGASWRNIKADEARQAFLQGADEIDMVMNVGMLKSGDLLEVKLDIQSVRLAVSRAILKVIIETCLLTLEEKILACKIAQDACADFVKTSTGFSTGGATVEDVKLMRKTVGPKMGVKASGGIQDYAMAMAMINAGATRLGCSAGIAIVEGSKK